MNNSSDFFLKDPTSLLKIDDISSLDKNSLLNILVIILVMSWLYFYKTYEKEYVKINIMFSFLFFLILLLYVATEENNNTQNSKQMNDKINMLLDSTQGRFAQLL